MNIFYFGENNKQLFGAYHSPKRHQNEAIGIIMCYPIGQEYMRAHRSYTIMANTFAEANFSCVTF